MLCQKCGTQEAVVHLETRVFRQILQEHLCEICAGVRATPRTGKAPTTAPSAAFDSAAEKHLLGYIVYVEKSPPITRRQEDDCWTRWEHGRRDARRILSTLPGFARLRIEMARRISSDDTTAAEVLPPEIQNRLTAYRVALPRLILAARQADDTAARAWRELAEAQTEAGRRPRRRAWQSAERALRQAADRFELTSAVDSIYLKQQRPAVHRILSLLAGLDEPPLSKPALLASVVRLSVEARLTQIEEKERTPASVYIDKLDAARAHLRVARRAHGLLQLEYLRHAIVIARQSEKPGHSLVSLVAAGNVGLLRALENLDHRDRRRFRAGVRSAIELAIKQALAAAPGDEASPTPGR